MATTDSSNARGKPPDPTGDRLAYSVPHAAYALDISTRSCWELIKLKKLRSVRVGRPRAGATRRVATVFAQRGTDGGAS